MSAWAGGGGSLLSDGAEAEDRLSYKWFDVFAVADRVEELCVCSGLFTPFICIERLGLNSL